MTAARCPFTWATILRIAPTTGGEKAVTENSAWELQRRWRARGCEARSLTRSFEVAELHPTASAARMSEATSGAWSIPAYPIAGYLSLAARDENRGELLKALGDVAKARGMAASALHPTAEVLLFARVTPSSASATPSYSDTQQERDQQRAERRFPRNVAEDA